ncbi:hypothetical protein [Dyella acidisoli]|uniref:Uncharacterized protein n=1 Tax=Dyella acidisoli TaxID=1867834 RepID=A0ABQ5XQN7_9GAMM|nr:hypothetical protein [Dyella acidisoli]GLQ93586.1 hypothetical protein GCM10007901_25370 [Dyella acidisoli]
MDSYTGSSVLHFDGSKVKLNVKSVAEAKQAIKELKVMKKALALRKKELMIQQKGRRSTYTRIVRTQGMMVRGRSGFASFLRSIQRFSRSFNRANLAHELAPMEDEIQHLDQHTLDFDTLITQLESFILQNSK